MIQLSVALIVAVLLAVPSRAAEIKPYGLVLVNYVQNWNRPNFADVPTQAISGSNALPPNQNLSLFTARQTRLGLNISKSTGPWDSDLSGVVEIDFFGLRNTGSAGLDVNAVAPRVRLAYIQAKRGNHAVVFGQDWVKAFAPLNPESLAHAGITSLSNSGNLWNRLPQLRWDADWELGGDWSAGTKIALVRSFSADEAGRTSGAATVATASDLAGSGEFSGGPAYQALTELKRKIDGRTFVIGASMQYLRESFNSVVPQPAGATNHRVDGLLGSGHLLLPILPSVTLSVEGFYGRSDQNLNGLGTVYNDLGNARTTQTRGGFAQAQVKPIKNWRFNAMAGFESIDQTGLAAGATAIFRNETIAANAIWDATADLALSLEFGRIHSYFVGALAGDTKNLGMAAQYRF
ncbi:MAG: hypothetical protein HY921_10475 [Elusimicrobia bacterium]|nr:hypothetical protein [Elusimicrobiota bacterium]